MKFLGTIRRISGSRERWRIEPSAREQLAFSKCSRGLPPETWAADISAALFSSNEFGLSAALTRYVAAVHN
jgi:hypothetical protein